VVEYHPLHDYPIVISEDGYSDSVRDVIDDSRIKLGSRSTSIPFVHIHHPNYNAFAQNGYFKLSRHFKYALDAVFNHGPSHGIAGPIHRVLILEEDLEIAPDFYSYFTAVAPMLDSDASLLCASAWNDNSLKGKVRDAKQLMRSVLYTTQ
jgi:alpha-1,3-mannosyl-glycoprotein beta-1,2-N-acetylglucosaminyltransferase